MYECAVEKRYIKLQRQKIFVNEVKKRHIKKENAKYLEHVCVERVDMIIDEKLGIKKMCSSGKK